MKIFAFTWANTVSKNMFLLHNNWSWLSTSIFDFELSSVLKHCFDMNIKSEEISFQYLQKRVNKNFTFSGNNNFQLFRSAQKQMTKKWNYELKEKYTFKRCSSLENYRKLLRNIPLGIIRNMNILYIKDVLFYLTKSLVNSTKINHPSRHLPAQS